MGNQEKEVRKFALGIKLINYKPKLTLYNLNIPNEIVITQLRNLIKMLEEDYYPNFKDNITKIGIGPE